MTTTLIAPRIFVTALSAATGGQWFDVEGYDNADELTQAIAESLQVPAGEFKVTDYEGFPAVLYSERTNLKVLDGYLEVLNGYNPYPPKEWFQALGIYLQVKGITQPSENTMQAFDDTYQGYYPGKNSKRKYAFHLLEILVHGSCDPEIIKRHLNINTFQQELFSGSYWEQDGHIFCE